MRSFSPQTTALLLLAACEAPEPPRPLMAPLVRDAELPPPGTPLPSWTGPDGGGKALAPDAVEGELVLHLGAAWNPGDHALVKWVEGQQGYLGPAWDDGRARLGADVAFITVLLQDEAGERADADAARAWAEEHPAWPVVADWDGAWARWSSVREVPHLLRVRNGVLLEAGSPPGVLSGL